MSILSTLSQSSGMRGGLTPLCSLTECSSLWSAPCRRRAQRMQNTSASHNEQPARLVVTWVLLIPLLYFSGGLWFQNRLVGYESGAYAPLAHQQTGETAVTSLIAYALLFLPLGSRAIYLTPLLKRNPVFVALP